MVMVMVKKDLRDNNLMMAVIPREERCGGRDRGRSAREGAMVLQRPSIIALANGTFIQDMTHLDQS